MIDVNKISYYFVAMTPDKKQHDITDLVQDGGWEEGKGELALHINGKLANEKVNGKSISSLIKNGCLVRILVSTGGKKTEVARGTLVEWEPNRSGSKNDFEFSAYDNLYNFQESHDNVYHSKGTKTKTALNSLFKKWKIPITKYSGPNVSHAKMAFKNQSLSDIVLDILDEAHTKSGKKSVVRSVNGKIQIVQQGSNKDVYHFDSDNTKVAQYKQSTAGMVTRVKVIGQENSKGKSKTVATVNGSTKYGIRQRIYVRPKDDSISAAKKEAKKILKEDGKVKKTMTVEAPDVPFIRKGDKVNVKAGAINGYCYVLAIRHYTDSATMTMDLEYV